MSDADLQVKEVTKLEKYLIRQKDSQFVKDLRALTKDQLKKKMQDQAIYRQETVTAKMEDEELKSLKEKVKDLQAPYNDSLKMNDKISRFVSLLLKDLE